MQAETRKYLEQALALFPESERERLSQIAERAIALHEQQALRPSGEAYPNHVANVAARIVNDFGIVDEELFIAGLFHDAVEDQRDLLCGHSDASREDAEEYLTDTFSPRVAAAVIGVTNTQAYEDEPDATKRNQLYVDHIIEACTANKDCCIVKLSDFFDNAMQLQDNKQPGGAKRGALKYGPLFDFFIDQLKNHRPEALSPDIARLLVTDIEQQQHYVKKLQTMRTIERDIAGALIFSNDDHVLIGKNKKGGVFDDVWVIPGGGIDEGEEKEAAVIREVLEEVGLDITSADISLHPKIQRISTEKTLRETGERVIVDMTMYNYIVRIDAPANELTTVTEDDFGNAEWIPTSELPKRKYSPTITELLQLLGLI